VGSVQAKKDDDVVIVGMARTAMTRAKKGPQKDTAPEVMLSVAFKGVLTQSGIDANLIEDIQVGNCLQPGAGSVTARMGQFLAGIPETASLSAVNRQCSSGLQAVMSIANSIRSRQIDIGIGAGVESMSLFSMMDGVRIEALSPQVFENPKTQSCLISMGITSENVAEKYGVTR
jgi:acetyl-CoA acyltransferase 1